MSDEILLKCRQHAILCGIDMSKFDEGSTSPPGGQDRFWMVGFHSQHSHVQCLYYPKSGEIDLTLFG
jgi:hypothetical protein